MRKTILILTAILCIATAAMAQTTWHVKTTGSDANSGKSWVAAFATLQTALDSAQAGDQIWVANGTYKPTKIADELTYPSTDPRDMAFVLKADVALYGGFAGTETLLNQRQLPPFGTPSATILSGDIGSPNDSTDNCFHVVISAGNVGNACVNGFTIVEGTANEGSSILVNMEHIYANCGGGMYNVNSSPILTHVTISRNVAYLSPYLMNFSGGGGMYNDNSFPILSYVIISENMALDGGGMHNQSFSFPVLTNVTINGNTAARQGGGMFNDESSPILDNVIISNNTASYTGGGICNDNFSFPILDNVTISNNTTSGSGGGMCNFSSSSPTITNTTISGNTATSQGGGVYNYYSSLILDNTTISNNSAAYGSGMCNFSSSPTITNATISGNIATATAGGIYNDNSSPILDNVSISNNSAGGYGGGMFNYNASSPELYNSIINGNTTYYGGGMNNNNSSPILDNVTISGNTAYYIGGGMNNYNANPSITNVVISGNTATEYGGGMFNVFTSFFHATNMTVSENTSVRGGGMYNSDSYFINSTNIVISGNTATNGGGLYNDDPNSSLENLTISGNTATGKGGGMYNNYSTISLTNIAVLGNTAPTGGGIYNDNSSPIITNNTISGNTATNGGGVCSDSSSHPTFYNSITWGNSTGVHDINGSTSTYYSSLTQGINSTANNCIDASTIGSTAIFVNPLSPGLNTGGDYNLILGSPCIDAGNNSYSTSLFDLANYPRIDIGGTIDLGAYERHILHTVTFNSNGGTTVNAIQAAHGYPFYQPKSPTRANYLFAGWYRDAGFINAWNFGAGIINQDTTLYAKWELVHTVTFESNGGTVIAPVQVISGTTMTAPATPTKTGSAFVGWYRDAGLVNAWNFATNQVTQDTTLYAKWATMYTATFNSNGGSAVASVQFAHGTTIPVPANPTQLGYAFRGWHSDPWNYSPWNFGDIVYGNITLYAHWESMSNCEVTYLIIHEGQEQYRRWEFVPYGSTLQYYDYYSYTPHTLAGWYKDSLFTEAWDFANDIATDNITLYGKLEPIKYTITFDTDGGSAIAPIQVKYDDTIPVPTPPTKMGYIFAGWYECPYPACSSSNTWNFSYPPNRDMTLYARWVSTSTMYIVTFESNGGSAVASYDNITYGTSIAAPVPPTKLGYIFGGWYKEEYFSELWDFTTDIVTDTITLYAEWTLLMPAQELCMVSVDENNHNDIVWKQTDAVVSYNLYREGDVSGTYNLIANVDYNSQNRWVDTSSNAKTRSYRYRISGIDTSGKESVLSDIHKTMHLTINAGVDNSWNLIWTPYEGTQYSTYNIYRSAGDILSTWELIGTMPSGNTSYTDFSAPAGYVYYMVEIVMNTPCVLTKSLSSIKSNMASNNPNAGGTGIVETQASTVKVYPNPAQHTLYIESSEAVEQVRVYDVSGRELMQIANPAQSIDVSTLANGIYIIKVKTAQGETVKKIVKQ